jgi:DNA-binding NtrC family response regulator
MRQLGERIDRIRTSSSTVLITGESGVGKELVARAIHNAGPKALKPFVPFNCSAAPRELIESQIFGYRRGAFTGATADSPGVARAARGGTLFLDEVGDLPIEMQPKLLRFLEYGEIQPLGEAAPLHVDLRLIAATNLDLERAVSERRFREDLFHRLNIIRLHVPPLRDRREDIPLLVAYFLEELATRAGLRQPPPIAEEALSALVRFPWPGNVRQLRNEIERLVTFCEEGATITRDLLSVELRSDDESFAREGGGGLTRPYDPVSIPLADRLRMFEVEQITRALADSSMNLTRASAQLGMARQNLQRRIKKLGLRVPDSSLTD